MSLLNDFQQQAIRDFRKSVAELLEELDDRAASFDLETVETCMGEILEYWQEVKAQLTDSEDGESAPD